MAKVLSGGLRVHGVVKKSEPGKPLISVVTVVFNRKKDFEITLKSIAQQTYDNIEFIVIDGGSQDGTLDMIKGSEDTIDVWISEPDKGIYDAMNKGIAQAGGEWINFMNAGDQFGSADVLELFKANDFSGTDILFGDALVDHGDFKTTFPRHPIDQIWKYSPFCHQAAFIRTAVMKEYRYDTQFRIGADHDFFYRAYLDHKKFRFTDNVVCLFDGRDGATRKWIVTAVKEKRNIALKYEYSIGKQLYYTTSILYLYLLIAFKRLLGTHLTQRIKKLLKGNQTT